MPSRVVITAPAPDQELQPEAPDFGRLTPTEHTLEPTHHIAFPGVDYISAIEFSPDGGTAYCLVSGYSIDLWAAGVHKWPQILGGLLAVLLLVYLLIVLRVRRRPQVNGEPHCRKCNYNVISHAPDSVKPRAARRHVPPGTLCPECGVDLSKKHPRRGRTTPRRLLIPSAFLLVCVGVYLSLFFTGYSGKGTKSLDLRSAWLDELAKQHHINWLQRHSARVTRIMAVDTESGRVKGSLYSEPGLSTGAFKVAPDGRYIALAGADHTLRWIHAASGRVRASTIGGAFQTSGARVNFIVGFDGPIDDPWVYYAAVDPDRSVSRLLRWHPRTDEQQVIIEEPAYTMNPSYGFPPAMTRSYMLLPRSDGTATISVPDYAQLSDQNSCTLTVRAPAPSGGAIEQTIEVQGRGFRARPFLSTPALLRSTSDGAQVFLRTRSGGIVVFDLATGACQRGFDLRGDDEAVLQAAVSASGSRLFVFVARLKGSVLVRDVVQRRWIARLIHPSAQAVPQMSASADGRRFAVVAICRSRGPHELALYDLQLLGERAK